MQRFFKVTMPLVSVRIRLQDTQNDDRFHRVQPQLTGTCGVRHCEIIPDWTFPRRSAGNQTEGTFLDLPFDEIAQRELIDSTISKRRDRRSNGTLEHCFTPELLMAYRVEQVVKASGG